MLGEHYLDVFGEDELALFNVNPDTPTLSNINSTSDWDPHQPFTSSLSINFQSAGETTSHAAATPNRVLPPNISSLRYHANDTVEQREIKKALRKKAPTHESGRKRQFKVSPSNMPRGRDLLRARGLGEWIGTLPDISRPSFLLQFPSVSANNLSQHTRLALKNNYTPEAVKFWKAQEKRHKEGLPIQVCPFVDNGRRVSRWELHLAAMEEQERIEDQAEGAIGEEIVG